MLKSFNNILILNKIFILKFKIQFYEFDYYNFFKLIIILLKKNIVLLFKNILISIF